MKILFIKIDLGMKKKELTVQDLRKAISNMNDEELSSMVEELSDEDFLEAEFMEDLSMDSLDVIEMTMEIEREHAIQIPDNAYERMRIRGGTVKVLLDTYNENL